MNGTVGKPSRLTFRNAVDGVAWQKQLRDEYAAAGAPNVDLNLKKSVVKPISRKQAQQVILKYEWLGTMASTSYHYGIFLACISRVFAALALRPVVQT